MRLSDGLSRYLDRLLARRAPWPEQGVPAPDGAAVPVARGGRAIWFRCADSGSVQALGGLILRLGTEMPGLWPLVTLPNGAVLAESDPDLLAVPTPGEDLETLSAFLDRWQPVAAVLLGEVLLPTTLQALRRRRVPVLAAGVRLPSGSWLERRMFRPLVRRHLAGFHYLLTEDAASLTRLRQLGAARATSAVGGALRAEVPVASANEAERESLAELLSSRPVWCAYAAPLAEIEALAEAQGLALSRSHRLLLVVVPADPQEGPAMQAALERAGLTSGLRSAGDEPTDDVSAYVADLGGEFGLWLRLAPLAFVGGTLTAGAVSRTPMEPAALGSAILHGPEVAGHAAEHARLTAAGGARQVGSAVELAAEIGTLLAPDQAAALAHAAWEVSSAGDEAAGLLLDQLSRALDAAQLPVRTG